jgi:hypothetical protein
MVPTVCYVILAGNAQSGILGTYTKQRNIEEEKNKKQLKKWIAKSKKKGEEVVC